MPHVLLNFSMHSKKALFAVLVIAVAVFTPFYIDPDGQAEAVVENAGGSDEQSQIIHSPPASRELAYEQAGILAWETYNFVQYYDCVNERDVVVTDLGLNSQTQEWDSLVHTDSSAFDIEALGSSGDDNFCFAGFGRTGAFVIQAWELVATGVGNPLNGLMQKRFVKSEIYRALLAAPPLVVNEVYGVDFDPEKRFVIALAGNGASRYAIQFSVDPAIAPNTLVDSGTTPEIGNAVQIQRMEHDLGRVWVFLDEWHSPVVLLLDTDNDGVFDGEFSGTEQSIAAHGFNLSDWSQWSNAFLGWSTE